MQNAGFVFGGAAGWSGFKDGSIVGRVAIDVPKTEAHFTLEIAFDEPELKLSDTVISALYKFARHAREVIQIFDR
jgi:hypothetical protein